MYDDKNYAQLLTDMKEDIGTGVQKGEGYLVYNALSALAYEMEKLYIQMDYLNRQSHADTADLDELVLIAKDRGIYQKKASSAYVKVKADAMVPIGTRFYLKSYHYVVVEELNASLYEYRAKCEETGVGPNNLTGELTAIDYVTDLEKAEITEVLVDGEEDENRESLYKRYLQSFLTESFGGNIAQYKEKVNEIAGVGGCKVEPVWNGPGTVKVIVISSEHGACSEYLIQQIQKAAVPEEGGSGYGFAPIDHIVTIESVEAVAVNVKTKISYMSGYSWSGIGSAVKEKIAEYLQTIADTWDSGDADTKSTVYISKLQAAVLDVPGVVDITETRLNGTAANLVLNGNQIPVLGEVSTV